MDIHIMVNWQLSKKAICWPVSHDCIAGSWTLFTPPPSKKKWRNHCFQFLLGITAIPREIQDNGYVKFWGVNKVHYGLCEYGELNEWMVMCFVKLSTDQLLVFNWSWAQFQNFPLSKKLCLAFGFDGIARFILLQWTQPWMTSYARMLKMLPVFLIVFILRIAVLKGI